MFGTGFGSAARGPRLLQRHAGQDAARPRAHAPPPAAAAPRLARAHILVSDFLPFPTKAINAKVYTSVYVLPFHA